MGTRGFVGFVKDKEFSINERALCGWYNHFDSYYEDLGLKVLEKYKNLQKKQLNHFFTNLLSFSYEEKFYENHKDVFDLDWTKDSVTLQRYDDFVWDGLYCEYGYIFDLDRDIVYVRRGFFKKPQFVDQRFVMSYKNEALFTHEVFQINSNNVLKVKFMFEHVDDIYDENNEYWEREYLQ